MENGYIDYLIEKYRQNGIVVDSNLMVLFLVGRYNEHKIQKFRATKKYDIRVYQLLCRIVFSFNRRFTTPNIVTELDNLSRQVDKQEWVPIANVITSIIPSLIEVPTISIDLIGSRYHTQVGITDCSIVLLSQEGLLVLTDDLPLTSLLESMGREVINISRFLA